MEVMAWRNDVAASEGGTSVLMRGWWTVSLIEIGWVSATVNYSLANA